MKPKLSRTVKLIPVFLLLFLLIFHWKWSDYSQSLEHNDEKSTNNENFRVSEAETGINYDEKTERVQDIRKRYHCWICEMWYKGFDLVPFQHRFD